MNYSHDTDKTQKAVRFLQVKQMCSSKLHINLNITSNSKSSQKLLKYSKIKLNRGTQNGAFVNITLTEIKNFKECTMYYIKIKTY